MPPRHYSEILFQDKNYNGVNDAAFEPHRMLWTTVANIENLRVQDDAVPANTTSSLFWQYAHDDCEGPHLWVADDGLTSPQLSFHADLVPSDSRIRPLSRWGVGIGQNWAVYQGDFDPDPDVSFLWSLGWLSGGASQDREFYIHAGFDPREVGHIDRAQGYMFKHIVNVHMLQLDAFALWGVDTYPASVVGDFWPADNAPSAPANRSVIVQRSNRQAPVELAASVVSNMDLSRLGDNLRVQICNEGTMDTASNWSRGASWSLTGSDDSSLIMNNGSTGATWTAPVSGTTARDFDVYLFHDQNHNQVCDGSDPHRKLKMTILPSTSSVVIDHIEYKMPGGDWTPAPAPPEYIVVPYTTSGVAVEFKAVRNNQGVNWPSGKPVWGKTGSGVEWVYPYPVGDMTKATFTVASTAPGNKRITAECGNTKEVRVTVVASDLKDVSFDGTKRHIVKKDDGSLDYAAPHWQDNSNPLDGDADDAGDKKYPVCFTRNTTMTVSATWKIHPANLGATLRAKGDGPGNLDFPETVATIQGDEMTISNVECLNPFVNAVDFFDPLSIAWKISLDSGATWVDAGVSHNQTYVTLGDPVSSVTLFHTLVHLGCKNADGETTAATTADSI